MHGHQLKRDHGERLCIFLTDGTPLELIYDLNAVMRHEQLFELPLRSESDKIREDILRHQPDLGFKELGALTAAEMVRLGKHPGLFAELAQWAYCLTETDREDKCLSLTWREFRRLLPAPPPTGVATRKAVKKLEVAQAWMIAVAQVKAREEIDEGNDESDGEDPSAPSDDNRG